MEILLKSHALKAECVLRFNLLKKQKEVQRAANKLFLIKHSMLTILINPLY